MDSNLKQLLYTHTETEEWHRTHPGELSPRYNRVETTTINGEEVYLFDWKETLDENPVGLIKESRFTDIPPHINRDMELNYVYDGVCTFIVNGRRLLLKKGDVLICNTGVVRSVPYVKGEHDIVISIVFKKEMFDSILCPKTARPENISFFQRNTPDMRDASSRCSLSNITLKMPIPMNS